MGALLYWYEVCLYLPPQVKAAGAFALAWERDQEDFARLPAAPCLDVSSS